MAPICCGLVPHLALALRPAPAGQPVVIVREERVLAASQEAGAGGVLPGLTRRQAETLCPAAVVLEADPPAAARLGGRLGAALYDLAPGGEGRQGGPARVDLAGVTQPAPPVQRAPRPRRAAAR